MRAGFPLTRYFLVTGLVTALVVGSVLAFITAGEVRSDLLEQREAFAVALAGHINRQVHERFLRPTIARDGFVDLERSDHFDALAQVVSASIVEFGVDRVYFFDLEGRIVYSTNRAHVGFTIQPDNTHFWQAARGNCATTAVVARGDPLDVGGQPGAVSLLETYVPVHALGPDGRTLPNRTGVIEIYQDATALLSETRRATRSVVLFSATAIGSLMLTLWLWIRKAQRTIDERTAALETLSRDLERQVEDRSRRLLQAETLATVGTLGAGVAHEVNNPMAAIASCAEGLLRRAESEELVRVPAFADFPEYLRIIRDEAFRVKEITRNLLDFSRGGAQRRTAVDLGELLRAAARLLEHQAGLKQRRLELDLPAAPVRIQGDPGGLRQLVLNVTLNALEASPQGGRVGWTLRATNSGAELACEDEGPGFSAEDLEHALEPFYTKKPVGSGTGLGLWIAWEVARQHGGAIELANSTRGRGARVVIRVGSGEEGANGQG